MFGVAVLLSLCVLIACGVWYHEVTHGNGPDRSVDLRPIAPIVTAVVALLLVWLAAGIAWIVGLARPSDGARDER